MSPCRTDDDDNKQGRLSFAIFCLLLILILVSLNCKLKPIYLKLHYIIVGPQLGFGMRCGAFFQYKCPKNVSLLQSSARLKDEEKEEERGLVT